MEYADLRSRFEDVAFTTAVPFTDDAESVDHDGLAENLEAMYDAGGRLFIPNGNTGEYYSLSHAERVAVVDTHAEALGPEATIAAGAAGSTKTVLELVAAYEDAGVDAVMVMHPDHTYLHEDGLAEYYHRICDATDLGVVIYKRGPEITRDVLIELGERENVVAVKFAVNDVKEFSQTVEDGSDAVTWMNGIAERYALSFDVEGATGYTTGIGNFVPEATLALFDALSTGDLDRARELRDLLRPYEDLREETGEDNALTTANNVPTVKYGLELAGLNGGPVREPLVDLSPADRARAEEYYATVRDADL